MTTPVQLVDYCPRCGVARTGTAGVIPFRCAACGLVLFFNPTVAAAAFVRDAGGRTLFITRAHAPAQGKLAIPGGFIDMSESAEEALRREVREEVGLELTDIVYLTSCPNRYEYRGITYPVCDLIFTAHAVAPESAQALDGVAGVAWRRLETIHPEELAFPSIRLGWEMLCQRATQRE
ncbi:MAG: NUDIX domain-containing protein [Bacteroidales bacterium]|nr:NUDIX domain-containing protein [Bacteroidales bacterium]